MDDLFLNDVLELYRDSKWKQILRLNEKSDNETAQKLMWVWPNEENLDFIRRVVVKHNLKGIISLGCGCGLLEWIIEKATGLQVIGYEINKEWWESKYSKPHFIKLRYCQIPLRENLLSANYALLFCYFNNGPAFLEYVEIYKGNIVFIIGPGDGKGRHADPKPFEANFGNSNWKMCEYQEIKDTKDFIAAYVKCEK